jgi:hypothetical protein
LYLKPVSSRRHKVDTPFIRYGLCLLPSVLADLVADDATDRCTANGSDRAAACKDRTTNGADSSANHSVPVTRRHRVTTTQAEQYCCGNRADCKPMHRFHSNTSVSNFS